MKMHLVAGVGCMAILLAGCTQPDGRFDFTDPSDPDNLVVLEEEDELAGYGAATAILLAIVAAWLAPQLLSRRLTA